MCAFSGPRTASQAHTGLPGQGATPQEGAHLTHTSSHQPAGQPKCWEAGSRAGHPRHALGATGEFASSVTRIKGQLALGHLWGTAPALTPCAAPWPSAPGSSLIQTHVLLPPDHPCKKQPSRGALGTRGQRERALGITSRQNQGHANQGTEALLRKCQDSKGRKSWSPQPPYCTQHWRAVT